MDTSDSNQRTSVKAEGSGNAERVVLFDGVCNLCNGSVQFLLRHDKAGKLKYASLQSAAASRLLKGFSADPAYLDSIVFVDGGRIYYASDAVLRIARYLGFPWRIFAGLRIIPRWIREPVYRFIARNRYNWFGKRDSCMLPDAEVRSRFLDDGVV